MTNRKVYIEKLRVLLMDIGNFSEASMESLSRSSANLGRDYVFGAGKMGRMVNGATRLKGAYIFGTEKTERMVNGAIRYTGSEMVDVTEYAASIDRVNRMFGGEGIMDSGETVSGNLDDFILRRAE